MYDVLNTLQVLTKNVQLFFTLLESAQFVKTIMHWHGQLKTQIQKIAKWYDAKNIIWDNLAIITRI
jgi:cell division protein FtsL